MGRRLRTTLPTLPCNLEPKQVDKELVQKRDEKMKMNNKKYFDKRNGARDLPPLQPGTIVLQKLDHERQWTNPATVVECCAPRSYLIQTSAGVEYRRNRRHLRPSATFKTVPRPYPNLPVNSPNLAVKATLPVIPFDVPRTDKGPEIPSTPARSTVSLQPDSLSPTPSRGTTHCASPKAKATLVFTSSRGSTPWSTPMSGATPAWSTPMSGATPARTTFTRSTPMSGATPARTTRSGRVINTPARYRD